MQLAGFWDAAVGEATGAKLGVEPPQVAAGSPAAARGFPFFSHLSQPQILPSSVASLPSKLNHVLQGAPGDGVPTCSGDRSSQYGMVVRKAAGAAPALGTGHLSMLTE